MEPILDPEYWRRRLRAAAMNHSHHAIFKCPKERWDRIEEKHKQILSSVIGPHDKILDVGCGWGRLLSLLPKSWKGAYVGVDISPDFLALARARYPYRIFIQGDIRDWSRLWWLDDVIRMDWAVLISMRPMIKRNLGEDVWAEVEAQVRAVAHKLLYLEYDEEDEGSVE